MERVAKLTDTLPTVAPKGSMLGKALPTVPQRATAPAKAKPVSSLLGKSLPTVPAPVSMGTAPESDAVRGMQGALKSLSDVMAQYPDFTAVLNRRYPDTNAAAIGGAFSGKGPDGKWGPLTDKALQTARTLAFTLGMLHKEMNLAGPKYDTHEFESAIPADYKSVPGEANEVAGLLAEELSYLSKYYKQVASQVTNRHMAEFMRGHQSELSAHEMTTVVPDVHFPSGATITLGDLSTPQAFALFLRDKLGIEPTPANISGYAKSIKQMVLNPQARGL